MRKHICALILLSILLGSCKEPATPFIPLHKQYAYREIPNMDVILEKLYQDYNPDPKSQEEKDQNLIIEFLTDNKIPAERTESGIYYKIYRYGVGANYTPADQFQARYTGYFLDGKVFDSNIDAKRPLVMRVGEMIQGWNEMLLILTQNCQAQLFIPSHLAYGKKGIEGTVPPNSVLIFDIELRP